VGELPALSQAEILARRRLENARAAMRFLAAESANERMTAMFLDSAQWTDRIR
jgi:hypothetical protein